MPSPPRSRTERGDDPQDGGMIDRPGIFDISESAYHSDPVCLPSLSASIAKILLDKSPRHAWFAHPRLNPAHESDNDKKFDFGKAVHATLLGAGKVTVVDAADYKTKAAKEQRDSALSAGTLPILADKWPRVMKARDAVLAELKTHEARDALTSGKPEQTMVWQEDGAWMRSKLDWLPEHGDTFYDLKTSGDANPHIWLKRAFETGADLQAAFYTRGLRAVSRSERPIFRFVIVETDEPFAVSVCQLSPAAVDLAERKVEDATRIWRNCMRANSWPGYPPFVHHIDAPVWIERKQADREARKVLMEDMQVNYLGA